MQRLTSIAGISTVNATAFSTAPAIERDWRGRFVPKWYVDPLDPRCWEHDLPYRRLPLSERDDTLYCIVDAEDYEWACAQLWFATHHKYDKRYAARSVYPRRGAHELIYLHKEILKRVGPPPSSYHYIGDHMNGNSLDNRRCNLRWATEAENNSNRYGVFAYQLSLFKPQELPA